MEMADWLREKVSTVEDDFHFECEGGGKVLDWIEANKANCTANSLPYPTYVEPKHCHLCEI